jgi:hypothetical protein
VMGRGVTGRGVTGRGVMGARKSIVEADTLP